MPLVERRRIIGSQAMLSQVTLRKGCVVPMHSHENEQFACVVSGVMRFGLKDGPSERHLTLRAGEVLHLPSSVPHSAEAIEDCVILDIFSPPSEKTGIDRA
jgi:quercetin dioxygenase-like cupin family protein